MRRHLPKETKASKKSQTPNSLARRPKILPIRATRQSTLAPSPARTPTEPKKARSSSKPSLCTKLPGLLGCGLPLAIAATSSRSYPRAVGQRCDYTRDKKMGNCQMQV